MPKQEIISNEEFNQWRSDPVTKKVIDRMDILVEYIKQQWYMNAFEDSGGDSALTDAYNRGFANGVHEFLRVDVEDVAEQFK